MSLVKTIEDVRRVINNVSVNNEGWPEMDTAESRYIKPLLGNNLFNALEAAITPTADETKLIQLTHAVSVRYTYARNLPFLHSQITNNGLRTFETENSTAVHRWEYEALRRGLIEAADEAYEALYIFLINNHATYPLWNRGTYDQSIVATGEELNQALQTHQPHRVCQLLQPLFTSVIDLTLNKAFGSVFLADLINKVRTNTHTDEEQELFTLIQKSAVRLAMKRAAQELHVVFSDLGFTVTTAEPQSSPPNQKDTTTQRLQMFAEAMQLSGLAYLSDAKEYANTKASASVLADYFSSSHYTDPNPEPYCPPPITGGVINLIS